MGGGEPGLGQRPLERHRVVDELPLAAGRARDDVLAAVVGEGIAEGVAGVEERPYLLAEHVDVDRGFAHTKEDTLSL